MALQHLRSSTANKRPIPTVMSAGQLAINTNEGSPGLFFKDSNGDLVKVGPVHIGTSAPNSTPDSLAATALVTGTVYQILTVGNSDFTLVGASANTVGTVFTATGTTTGTGTVSGQQGNEKGEQWLDTTGSAFDLKIYDGNAWRSQAGEFVNVTGDTMTGAFGVVAGTASAPGVFFSGDTNTGLLSPGGDSVAVTTGGTQRVVVDSSGRVLVGTTTEGHSDADNLTIADSSKAGITIRNTTTTGDGAIFFSDATSGTAEYAGYIEYGHSTNHLRFATASTERLRIDSSGKVGIGTSSPDGELDVTGTGDTGGGVLVINDAGTCGAQIKSPDPTILFYETDTTNTNYQLRLSSGTLLVQKQNDALNGADTKIAIDSSGNVVLGYAGTSLYFKNSFNNSSSRISNAGGSNSSNFRFLVNNSGSESEAMRIDSSGHVAIGSTTATTHFSVVDGSVGLELDPNLGFSSRANTGTLRAYDRAGSAYRALGLTGAEILFGISDSEKMRIDSSGRLLVGTSTARANFYNTTASAAFQVEGQGGTGDSRRISVISCDNSATAGGAILLGLQRSGAVGGNTIVQHNDNIGAITFQGNDGAQFVETASIKAQVDGTPGSNDMPGRLVLSTTADGASSSTERMRIDSSGNVKIIGSGTSSTPKIALNASGSASFAGGDVEINEPGSSNGKVNIDSTSDGGNSAWALSVKNNDSRSGRPTLKLQNAGNGNAVEIKNSGNTATTTTITTSGAATFVNRCDFGNTSLAETAGKFMNSDASSATLYVMQYNGSGDLFSGRNSSNNEVINLGVDGSATFASFVEVTRDTGNQTAFASYLSGSTDSTFKVTANGSATFGGNVGIGTTSPQRALVVSDAGTEGFEFYPGSSAGNNTVNHYNRSTSSFVNIITTADQHIFSRADGEKVRIDQSGNVLIGTTSAIGGELSVVDGSGAQIALARNDSGSTVSGNALGQIRFYGNQGGTYSDIGRIICSADFDHGSTSKPTNLRFFTTALSATSTTERMRIDSSGRLLLGTTTAGNINAVFDDLIIGNGSGGRGMTFYTGTTDSAYISFNDTNSNSSRGTIEYSHAQDSMRLYTANAERMRIDSAGTAYFQSSVNVIGALSDVGAGTANRLYYGAHSRSGIAGTISYTVWTNGDVDNTNNSYGALSDVKLKENIVDASSQWDDVKDIRIRNYNFIEGQTHTQIGVVAQEVETVSPGLVSDTPDTDDEGNDLGTVTKSVKYSVLYMKAVKALQEAMERIEQLETKVAALEAG